MKYILKKEYPGSPKLGYIDDLNKSGYNNQGEYVQSMYDKNPEFWEQVVEKDYEILSVITNNGKFIEKVYNQDATIEPYWKIHSIKRKSDGEIFTIGDKLDDKSFTDLARHPISLQNWDNIITKIGIIENYSNEVAGYNQICDGELMFSASNMYDNYNVLLKDGVKCKQPLFTTEQVKEIENIIKNYIK